MDSRHVYSLLLTCILATVGSTACVPSNELVSTPTIEPSEPPPTATIPPPPTATITPTATATAEPTETPTLVRGASLPEDNLIAELPLFNQEITALAWSPDGSYLAVGSAGVFLWNLVTNDLLSLPAHDYSGDNTICSVEFGANGTIVAASWPDGEIRVWNVTTGEVVFSTNIGYACSTLALDSEGDFLVAARPHERFPKLLAWNMNTSELLYEFDSYSARALDINPQGTLLATAAHTDNRVVLLDLQSGNTVSDIEITNPPGGTPIIGVVSFSPDGTTFRVIEVGTGRLTGWGTETGERLYSIDIPKAKEDLDGITVSSISRTGSRVVSKQTPFDPLIMIWDYSTGQMLYEIAPTADRIPFRVAISPDGSQLAVGGQAGNLMLWELP